MDSDNDSRAVDWPEKQVARLDGELERMSENFTQRLDGLDKADGRKGDRLQALEKKITGFEGRIRLIENTNSDLIAQVEAIKDYIRQLDLSAQEAAVEAPIMFSAPIGGQRIDEVEMELSPENWKTAMGGGKPIRHGGIFAMGDPARGVVPREVKQATAYPEETMIKEAFERGHLEGFREAERRNEKAYHRGVAFGSIEALSKAQDRVRQYMEGHFSSATIEGIMAALRG